MSSNSKVLENLQQALSMELSAVHQYLMHAHILDNWGMDRLAAQMREEMQEELGHAGGFIDRILFLKGEPRIVPAKTPEMATSLEAMFEADLADERSSVAFYTEAAEEAAKESDIGTRTLFEQTLLDEEGHAAWLELQLDLLERMGQGAYIAKHMTAPGD